MFSAIAATGVYSTAAADNGEYRNPVISQSAPDPTVILSLIHISEPTRRTQ